VNHASVWKMRNIHSLVDIDGALLLTCSVAIALSDELPFLCPHSETCLSLDLRGHFENRGFWWWSALVYSLLWTTQWGVFLDKSLEIMQRRCFSESKAEFSTNQHNMRNLIRYRIERQHPTWSLLDSPPPPPSRNMRNLCFAAQRPWNQSFSKTAYASIQIIQIALRIRFSVGMGSLNLQFHSAPPSTWNVMLLGLLCSQGHGNKRFQNSLRKRSDCTKDSILCERCRSTAKTGILHNGQFESAFPQCTIYMKCNASWTSLLLRTWKQAFPNSLWKHSESSRSC
jgi:hypothetical protein